MTQVLNETDVTRIVLRTRPAVEMDDDQFLALCQQNPELRFERTADGDVIIMPPTFGDTGSRNFDLGGEFYIWAKRDGRGRGFDSSTGFKLPNGALRSPDVAWVLRERLASLTPGQRRRKFLALCPDFVIELRSASDSLTTLQEKMEEYLANGARLGWLVDPVERRAYIYRPNRPVELLDDPATLSGDPELPGFVLDVQAIFADL